MSMSLSERHCLKVMSKTPADWTRQSHAFTFVELLVVIALVVVLAIFLVPALVFKEVDNSVPLALSAWLAGGLLSLLGALLGAAVAWLLFNGNALNTSGGQFGSDISFRLLVGPSLFAVGVVWACAIGLIGGLFPAIRAARLPVAVALRPT